MLLLVMQRNIMFYKQISVSYIVIFTRESYLFYYRNPCLKTHGINLFAILLSARCLFSYVGSQCSDLVTGENKPMMIATVNGTLSTSQPLSGYQAAWSGVPGQVSMADIVKMGRSHSKASSGANPAQYGLNQHHVQTSRSSEDHVSTGHHDSPNDDWPLIESPPTVRVPPVLEQPLASDLHVDASNFSSDMINQHPQSPKDEFREPVDDAIENINTYHVGSGSAATHKMQEDKASGDFLFSDGMYENMASYQTHRSGFEQQEGELILFLVQPEFDKVERETPKIGYKEIKLLIIIFLK